VARGLEPAPTVIGCASEFLPLIDATMTSNRLKLFRLLPITVLKVAWGNENHQGTTTKIPLIKISKAVSSFKGAILAAKPKYIAAAARARYFEH
jgi:hypothetical protein